MIYVIFSLCWIPYALIIVIDKNDTFTYEPHLILTAFGHLHPSINWPIYYFTNKNFEHAFNELVKLDRLFHFFKMNRKEESNELSRTDANFIDAVMKPSAIKSVIE